MSYELIKQIEIKVGFYPCTDASLWLTAVRTDDPQTAWERCPRSDWMAWWVRRVIFTYSDKRRLAIVRKLFVATCEAFLTKKYHDRIDDLWQRARRCDAYSQSSLLDGTEQFDELTKLVLSALVLNASANDIYVGTRHLAKYRRVLRNVFPKIPMPKRGVRQ